MVRYNGINTIASEKVNDYVSHITEIDEISCCYMLHDISEWKMYVSVWTRTIEKISEDK